MSVLCLVLLMLPGNARAADDPYAPMQWGLERVQGRRAWQVADGTGTIVAIIDSGVRKHPDLSSRLVPGYDFVDDDREPWDENGHGTLIAGIVAAEAGNGIGIAGLAPGAKIMPVRVLDKDGTGSSSDVADGIRWAVDHGARVVNLSLAQDAARGVLGNLLADPAVDEAITEAANGGATVVIAAGNDPSGGTGETAYDATVPGAIVVGGTTKGDRRAAYSNYGDGLDLVAPGGGSATEAAERACTQDNGIVSTWWNPETGRASYGAGCGTSMAVAFVSAAAAMLHEKGLTNVQVTQRLIDTAVDLGAPGPDPASGAGRLDAARAVGAPTARPRRSPSSDPQPRPTSTERAQGSVVAATPRVSPTQRVREMPAPKTSATQVEPRVEHAFGGGIPPRDTPAERAPIVAAAGAMLCALVVGHLRRAMRRFRRS